MSKKSKKGRWNRPSLEAEKSCSSQRCVGLGRKPLDLLSSLAFSVRSAPFSELRLLQVQHEPYGFGEERSLG